MLVNNVEFFYAKTQKKQQKMEIHDDTHKVNLYLSFIALCRNIFRHKREAAEQTNRSSICPSVITKREKTSSVNVTTAHSLN